MCTTTTRVPDFCPDMTDPITVNVTPPRAFPMKPLQKYILRFLGFRIGPPHFSCAPLLGPHKKVYT